MAQTKQKLVSLSCKIPKVLLHGAVQDSVAGAALTISTCGFHPVSKVTAKGVTMIQQVGNKK